jgi:hypothetical protein
MSLGLILTGLGLTVGILTVGSFGHNKATLHTLTSSFEKLTTNGSTSEELQVSLDSLANAVLDYRIAVDYLLAD